MQHIRLPADMDCLVRYSKADYDLPANLLLTWEG